MIRIGLNKRDKQKVINEYLQANEIKKIKIFYFKNRPEFKFNINEVEYIEWSDIIMYKFFYRLLEEIDKNTLVVIDELMRTQNRNDLTYNCTHHYLNQTPHRIIFEYFPIIEDKEDFMILLNFENKNKYKGKSFEYGYLYDEDIKMKPHKIKLELINVEITEKEKQKYEDKKNELFDNLGNKDPDTIPRNLQLLAGDFKKKAIEVGKLYVARNKRFKLDNVFTYDEITKNDYIVIDMHFRRINFNDFLKTTQIEKVKYLNTILSIDTHVVNEFMKWKARLDSIYAQASLY